MKFTFSQQARTQELVLIKTLCHHLVNYNFQLWLRRRGYVILPNKLRKE